VVVDRSTRLPPYSFSELYYVLHSDGAMKRYREFMLTDDVKGQFQDIIVPNNPRNQIFRQVGVPSLSRDKILPATAHTAKFNVAPCQINVTFATSTLEGAFNCCV
jgi:hypothetical protein